MVNITSLQRIMTFIENENLTLMKNGLNDLEMLICMKEGAGI